MPPKRKTKKKPAKKVYSQAKLRKIGAGFLDKLSKGLKNVLNNPKKVNDALGALASVVQSK